MPRPFTPQQRAENAAFLRHLRRTGNAREAARALGRQRSTFLKRRAKHPVFAGEWDAALALANADAHRRKLRSLRRALDLDRPARPKPAEPRPVLTRSGRLQLRAPQARRLDRAAEQAFLSALSATANVRLSAAAAGFTHAAFYERKRRDPAFAREWRWALAQGYETVELALLESWSPASGEHDAWRSNDPPATPPMTVNQAFQLLHLHDKEVRNRQDPPEMRRRRSEPDAAYRARLADSYLARLAREAEHELLGEVLRNLGRVDPRHLPPAPSLPALDQVTGWSKADPAKTPYDEGRALFGGFRVEHQTAEQKALFRKRRGGRF